MVGSASLIYYFYICLSISSPLYVSIIYVVLSLIWAREYLRLRFESAFLLFRIFKKRGGRKRNNHDLIKSINLDRKLIVTFWLTYQFGIKIIIQLNFPSKIKYLTIWTVYWVKFPSIIFIDWSWTHRCRTIDLFVGPILIQL